MLWSVDVVSSHSHKMMGLFSFVMLSDCRSVNKREGQTVSGCVWGASNIQNENFLHSVFLFSQGFTFMLTLHSYFLYSNKGIKVDVYEYQ